MANHLIIGLGGTGGKILREMRKRIYEEFRSNEPAGQIHMEYLYVDSSPADLDDRGGWKTLGGSVHLLDAQKVSIHGVGSGVLDNLHQYPGIQSFITPEDRGLLNDISALITDGIGGQRRRLGRLLFANNLSGPVDKSFGTRLMASVQKLTDASNENKVTFHVCAGLAGGTGSGSVVDTITQIRKHFAPLAGIGDQYKLNLYLYVPEMIVANPAHNAGYYQANGYAALSEINAMSVKSYQPYDVTGKSVDEYGHVKRLLQGVDAFEAAYLFSNVNESGHQLQIGSELPAAVADFLFQKIIAANMSAGGQMARLVTCENNGASPELDGANIPVHSRKFMAFGVKRVEYPETEVREYVTYSFARQAARQLQYNLWRDGIGYDECSISEVGLGFKSEIEDKKSREELMLSEAYLTLSKPIVDNPSTAKWKSFGAGWEGWTQRFAEDAQTENVKKNWFGAFTTACELQYNTNFRGHGVKEFFKIQRKEKAAYATYIRRNIEERLFNEWKNGTKSILEIEKFVNLLIEDCDERLPKFKDKISQLESYLENECNPEIVRCNKEWNGIGWIREAITNAASKVFSRYKTAKCDFYTQETKIEGYRYAVELIQMVKTELTQMQANVVTFRAILTTTLKNVEELAESKCKVQSAESKSDNKIVKKYNPEQVRDTTKQFITDEEHQRQNAAQVRNEIVNLLGEDGKRSFSALCDRVDISTAESIMEQTCIVNAAAMMNDLASADPTLKMLDVNIMEKIKQEYNSDDRLEEFIRGLIKSAQCYLQFNSEEISKVLAGSNTQMMRMVQLCLPEYNDPSNFRQRFIGLFKQICPGFNEADDLSTNYKANQIVVIAAASGFPLRFVANIANLKNRYDEMMIGPKAALNKMVLHTESNLNLPSLFEKSIVEKRKELIPYAVLTYAMGLAVDKTDPSTGMTFKAIGFKDELGMIGNWVSLGKNVLQACEQLAIKDMDADKVCKLVDEKLRIEYLHNEKKAVLKQNIAELINNEILPLCGNNDLDPMFVAYKQAAISIIQTKLVEK